ncbi:unnamed protein product [Oppiella nova]|uniref:Chromatin assembly factor 1 subunit A n=1 Tax=Oppiella nova TaxID=334625 RepID=A0A7R9MC53_9ACAR|nr:unnamed protein product [Oppiella nova]CAG2173387.1 unnamed protein product [Oppiella nova]
MSDNTESEPTPTQPDVTSSQQMLDLLPIQSQDMTSSEPNDSQSQDNKSLASSEDKTSRDPIPSEDIMNRSLTSSEPNLSHSEDNNKSLTKSAEKSAKKKRKLTPQEKKRALEERNRVIAEREAEKERKTREIQEKKDLLERQRLERQKLKDAEKEKREKERVEKEMERQRMKDEKQKEKEDRLREREEKQKEKDLEKQKKLEEISEKKRKLEEEKSRRLSEKQKASEEQLKKEERQRQLLSNFFKNSANQSSNRKSVLTSDETITNSLFLPFQLGANQTIAPAVPEFAKNRFNREVLDTLSQTQDSDQLYLDSIKSIDYHIFRCNGRQKSEPEIIIESTPEGDDNENQPKRYRIKHLQFHTNVRPPYRGTFRKRSHTIKATQPFNRDTDVFDYEVDSDEEWEEGGPGESLDGSDSDGSVKDDYEIDNEIFVPHGYLSEDENEQNEDQLNSSLNQDVDMTDMSDDKIDPKDTKCLPLLKEQVLMAERNRCFSRTMNPVIIGCVWESNANNNQKSVDFLQSFRRISIQIK